MSQDQTTKSWRDYLVTKLQDRYGLTQKQAQTKANVWLRWIQRKASLEPGNLAAAEMDQRREARLDVGARASASRPAASTHS
jgi:hypothetical protein